MIKSFIFRRKATPHWQRPPKMGNASVTFRADTFSKRVEVEVLERADTGASKRAVISMDEEAARGLLQLLREVYEPEKSDDY